MSILTNLLHKVLFVILILTTSSLTAQNEKTNNMVKTLTKSEFIKLVHNYEKSPKDWKYLGDKPCIIDFYADWCAPCRSIAPVLEELAKEYKGQIYIYKIDTEKEHELAQVFGIRSLPSLLFVPLNGAPQMAQGALPKTAFKEAIETVLLNKK